MPSKTLYGIAKNVQLWQLFVEAVSASAERDALILSSFDGQTLHSVHCFGKPGMLIHLFYHLARFDASCADISSSGAKHKVADWAAAVRFLAYVLGLGLQPSVRSWDAAIAAVSGSLVVPSSCCQVAGLCRGRTSSAANVAKGVGCLSLFLGLACTWCSAVVWVGTAPAPFKAARRLKNTPDTPIPLPTSSLVPSEPTSVRKRVTGSVRLPCSPT